ncbi:NAD(P)H-dependent flavin oxidoreductase YrpB (nitropropane dioxygenase family) [Crossiella equi]|uniref:Propionate 3-nitronate monooxygenase n=1 Tax=Crossiella equi TaxID=130796 RepID=A0ABS5AQ84_9PSEU|nr:nitronate monooxygenase [Crossiella equi]MBP2478412.1 NAD(P)H-dependent flavin oxidoreductase YrpB (nitropropane dioxygenase family) [Crossiella equi]
MDNPLAGLGLTTPLLAAPMAGGPTTPALVGAAARAGGLGFLAAGYLAPEAFAAQLALTRAQTSLFGVNLFAPNPVAVDPAAYTAYRDRLRADAERFGAELPETPVEDDDWWRDKVDLLLADPVPVVSFTFGLPDAAALAGLRRAGSLLVQTVTSAEEGLHAVEAGVDAIIVQAAAAGGHSATFTPGRPLPVKPLPELLTEVNHAVGLPKIAAGGVVRPEQVRELLTCCARAVLVGTALLLTPEAGTSAAHRAALSEVDRGDTVLTRAFTGRPARALRNGFLDAHDAAAPLGYPALHHLTRPIRRAGEVEHVNLWAGTGYREVQAKPAAEVLAGLAAHL